MVMSDSVEMLRENKTVGWTRGGARGRRPRLRSMQELPLERFNALTVLVRDKWQLFYAQYTLK